MSDDLAVFLRARLDEDEAAALAAGGVHEREWDTVATMPGNGAVYDGHGDIVVYDEGSPAPAQIMHIVRHDPARVLREVDAWRKIIEAHSPSYPVTFPVPSGQPTCCEYESYETLANWPCPTVLALAAIWSDHPDYRQEWKP